MSKAEETNSEQRDVEPPLKVYRFIRGYGWFIYNYPYVPMIIVICFVGSMVGWIFGIYGLSISAQINYYRWSKTDVVAPYDAYVDASERTYHTGLNKKEKKLDLPQQSAQGSISALIYEVKNGNALTVENIRRAWKLEDQLFNNQSYNDYCYKPNKELLLPAWNQIKVNLDDRGCYKFQTIISVIKTVLIMLHLEPKPENVNDIVLKTVLGLVPGSPPAIIEAAKSIRANLIGSDFSEATGTSSLFRTLITTGFPHKGYKNLDDRFDDQLKEQGDWGIEWIEPVNKLREEKPDGLETSMLLPGATEKEISNLILHEVLWLIGSFAFVFAFAAIHLKSIMVSLLGVLGIFFSIPSAIAFMFGVMTIHHFDALNVIGFFLICGIGSDSIFILFDNIKQSEHFAKHPLVTPELRLAYAVQQGSIALAGSILTTSIAFLALCISKLRILMYFGIFCFWELIFSLIFALTWYIAVLALWMRFVEFKLCNKPKDEKSEEDEKPLDNIDSRPDDEKEEKSIDMEKGEGISASSVKSISDTKSESTPEKKSSEEEDENEKSIKEEDYKSFSSGIAKIEKWPYDHWYDCFRHKPVFNINCSGLFINEYSIFERFFHNYWAPFIYFYRAPILFIILVVTVVMGYYTFQMKADVEIQYLPNDQYLQNLLNVLSNDFPTRIDGYSLIYYWGIYPKLHVSVKDTLSPDKFGETEFTPIDISSAEAQNYLMEACTYVKSRADLIDMSGGAGSYTCPIELLEAFANTIIINPTTNTHLPFPIPASLMKNHDFIVNFTKFLTFNLGLSEPMMDPGASVKDTIGFDLNDDHIVYIGMSFNMKVPPSQTNQILHKMYDEANDIQTYLRNLQNQKAPSLGDAGYQAANPWVTMETQDQLEKQALDGVLWAVLFSIIVIFIVTLSISYTLFFLISVASVIMIIVGILYNIGWSIGFNESVMIIIACGFCTDFIIQTMNSMAHEFTLTMFGKMQRAVTIFSAPVFSALVTTLGAGCFLYGSIILLFPPFATFLIMSGIFGIFHGFVTLPVMSAWFGFEKGDNLVVVFSRIKQRRNRKKVEVESSESAKSDE